VDLNKILSDPNWMPQSINPGNIIFEEISADTLKSSAFLDGRAKGKTGRSVSVPITHLLTALPNLRNAENELFEIFHISHVGSTFIARLLDEFGNARVYREPTVLKGLAYLYREFNEGASPFDRESLVELQELVFALLIQHNQKNIVKHSSQNLIIPKNAKNRRLNTKPALYIFTSLENFIAHGVASPGLKADAINGGASRVKHFNSLSSMDRLNLFELSELQRIALVWMSEVLKINSRYRMDLNDYLFDFDKTLATKQKTETVEILANHFRFDLKSEEVSKIVHSDVWIFDSKGGSKKSYSDRLKKMKQNKTKYKKELTETIDWVCELTHRNLHLHPLDLFL